MICIKRGNQTLQVTNGAYENYYKNKGFVKVDKVEEQGVKLNNVIGKVEPITNSETIIEPEQQQDDNVADEIEESVDDKFKELMEKPVSEWTKAELKSFVKEKGIEVNLQNVANENKGAVIKKAVADYLDNNG